MAAFQLLKYFISTIGGEWNNNCIMCHGPIEIVFKNRMPFDVRSVLSETWENGTKEFKKSQEWKY